MTRISDFPAQTVLSRRRILGGVGAAAVTSGLALPGIAQAATPMRFSCDYRIYGSTAPFVYGADLGLYEQAGISPTIDGSLGSADSITRVASGTYDFGCADASTLVQFAENNPNEAPVLIMPIYDRSGACIISLKDKPVTSFKGLEGIRLGVSTADAGSRLLPGLLRLHNVDASKIQMVTIQPAVRDTLLLQHRVDAVIGFDYTTLFDLMSNGVAEQDVRFVYFADNGFNFYAGSLIASRKQVADNPALVKSVADIVAKSWVASAKTPSAAIASVVKRVPLTDVNIETARLKWVLDHLVMTPNVRANGLGNMDQTRLKDGIAMIKQAFNFKTTITGKDIYDGHFQPPLADRTFA